MSDYESLLLAIVGYLPFSGIAFILIGRLVIRCSVIDGDAARSLTESCSLGITRIVSLLSTLLALILFSGIARNLNFEVLEYRLGNWLSIAGVTSFEATSGLRINEPVTILVLAVIWALVTLLSFLPRDDQVNRNRVRPHDVGLLLAAGAFTWFLLAFNFVQLLIAWQFSTIGIFLMMLRQSQQTHAAIATRKFLLINIVGDLFLLSGLAISWYLFGRMDINVTAVPIPDWLRALLWSDESMFSAEELTNYQRWLNTAGYCLIAAIVVRCAQFPFSGGLTDTYCFSGRVRASLAVLHLSGGLLLLHHAGPLLRLTEGVVDALVVIALATLVFSTISSFGRGRRAVVLLHLTAAQFALALLCASSLRHFHYEHMAKVSVMLTVPLLAMVHLWSPSPVQRGQSEITEQRTDRQFPVVSFGFVTLILASGLGIGGHPIFVGQFSPDDITGSSPTDPHLWSSLKWPVIFGTVLLAAAQIRAFFVRDTEMAGEMTIDDHSEIQFKAKGILFSAVVSSVVLTGAVLILLFRIMMDSRVMGTIVPDAGRPGIASLISLLAVAITIIVAFLWYRKRIEAVSQERQISISSHNTFDALGRLARNGFYIDDTWFLLLILPVRTLGQLCRIFDWLIVDGLMTGIWKLIPRVFQGLTRPLATQSFGFFATAVLLCVSALVYLLAFR